MIIGTCHFYDMLAACLYYSQYGVSKGDVQRKLDEGEIKLGRPEEKEGERVWLDAEEGRYFKKL